MERIDFSVIESMWIHIILNRKNLILIDRIEQQTNPLQPTKVCEKNIIHKVIFILSISFVDEHGHDTFRTTQLDPNSPFENSLLSGVGLMKLINPNYFAGIRPATHSVSQIVVWFSDLNNDTNFEMGAGYKWYSGTGKTRDGTVQKRIWRKPSNAGKTGRATSRDENSSHPERRKKWSGDWHRHRSFCTQNGVHKNGGQAKR